VPSTEIERLFFGTIDNNGKRAVTAFSFFDHQSFDQDHFRHLMLYMSTQKLRTPKGLGWLADQLTTTDHHRVLAALLRFQQIHCAIWTEAVWQIADASQSDTKFIISDHPVTVYNRTCGPGSGWCRGNSDPDISQNGTHTYFPLSWDKVLILTNLSWVRNPYQKAIALRPNANPWRNAIINFTEIQILRHLSEDEVLQINFITKARSLRYIAAAKEEWLYPERFVSKSDWAKYGNGYLFMPDPRSIHLGGTVMWGGGPGPGGAVDTYGRPPWDPDFEKEGTSEGETLQRFQGEFAHMVGPDRRGRGFSFGQLDKERDSDDYHAYHLGLFKKK